MYYHLFVTTMSCAMYAAVQTPQRRSFKRPTSAPFAGRRWSHAARSFLVTTSFTPAVSGAGSRANRAAPPVEWTSSTEPLSRDWLALVQEGICNKTMASDLQGSHHLPRAWLKLRPLIPT